MKSAEERIFDAQPKGRERTPVVALNQAARLAYRRQPGSEEWEAITPDSLALAPNAERIGNAKIGDRWFRLYRASASAARQA